jgi:pyruvate formate lyase activating enzyme
MTSCVICNTNSPLIARNLGVCLSCLRRDPSTALEHAAEAHHRSRKAFDLPEEPPNTKTGVRCGLCSRQCVIGEGERGFCGLRTLREGRLYHLAGTPSRGLLHWYRDPLPTNCVADWVCDGHTRYGRHNLAVFYASCTLNCLFCQNWHFKTADPRRDKQGNIQALSAKDLAACANERTHCVCFFGGDPASQMPHAIATSRLLAKRGVAICWETAGTMHPRFLRVAVELSLNSRGCIKFDLKAYDSHLHRLLTGASNARTLENFSLAAERYDERPDPPLVVASTLLVPGYVDADEVAKIARFIADHNPNIPYALLGFHPNFYLDDLPCTSSRHAGEALEAAHDAGLKNVRLGNVQLLSNAY